MVDVINDTDKPPMKTTDDEVMRKLLKPVVTEVNVMEVLLASYTQRTPTGQAADTDDKGVRVLQQLDSYDDCNWKVAIGDDVFLLKVHNGVESNEFLKIYEAAGNDYYKLGHAGSSIHFQNAIMETLHQSNIPTSIPVHPTTQDDSKDRSSPVSIHTLSVISEAHSPRKLVVRLLKWIDGRCMSDIPLLPLEALADAGRMLGRVDAALDQLCPDTPQALYRRGDFGRRHSMPIISASLMSPTRNQLHLTDVSLMKAARRYHQWDGKNTVDLRKFVDSINDKNRRSMVESVIDSFEQTFVTNPEEVKLLRSGILMGDFNDANILVDQDLQVCGVIDFGDSVERFVQKALPCVRCY